MAKIFHPPNPLHNSGHICPSEEGATEEVYLKWIPKLPGEPFCDRRDFNNVLRSEDRPPCRKTQRHVAHPLRKILERLGLEDTAPYSSPHTFKHRKGKYTARLERCYITNTTGWAWLSQSLIEKEYRTTNQSRYPSSRSSDSHHDPPTGNYTLHRWRARISPTQHDCLRVLLHTVDWSMGPPEANHQEISQKPTPSPLPPKTLPPSPIQMSISPLP